MLIPFLDQPFVLCSHPCLLMTSWLCIFFLSNRASQDTMACEAIWQRYLRATFQVSFYRGWVRSLYLNSTVRHNKAAGAIHPGQLQGISRATACPASRSFSTQQIHHRRCRQYTRVMDIANRQTNTSFFPFSTNGHFAPCGVAWWILYCLKQCYTYHPFSGNVLVGKDYEAGHKVCSSSCFLMLLIWALIWGVFFQMLIT